MTTSFYRIKIILLLLSLSLSGCTTPFTPNFAGMSASYANILEQYQLNSILSNIVRAADERPLSFLDIPSINGTGNISNTVGLSPTVNGFTTGLIGGTGGITSVGPSLSIQVGNSFQFTQSSLDNATFLRGFLSQIPVETAKYFIADHLPKELVFSLVIASIQIKDPNGTVSTFRNNPLLPEHEKFQQYLYELLDKGLEIRPVPNTPPPIAAPVMNNQQGQTTKNIKPVANAQIPSLANPTNMMPPSIGNFNQSYYGAGNQTFYGNSLFNSYGFGGTTGVDTTRYKLCLNVGNYSDFKKLEFAPGVYCHVNEMFVNESNQTKPELLLSMRSPNTLFDYLGQVVVAQNQVTPYMVTIPPSKNTPPRKVGQQNQYALLVVNKNFNDVKSFASIVNLDGDAYSIPSKNNGYSPIVIKFVSQLLSLNKVPGSIPPSPAILLN